MCAIDNFIYAVGGYDGSSQLRTVERYDIEADEWTFIGKSLPWFQSFLEMDRRSSVVNEYSDG